MAAPRHLFPPLVEGLTRAMEGHLTPELRRTLRDQGLDLDRTLPSSWPAEHFPRWIRTLAAALSPGAPEAEACRQLGRAYIEGAQKTMVGSAVATLLKMVGPRRSLARLHHAYRTGDDYLEVTVEDLGEGHALVRFSDISGVPSYYLGQLEAGAAMVGAHDTVVTLEPGDGPGATFRLRYQA